MRSFRTQQKRLKRQCGLVQPRPLCSRPLLRPHSAPVGRQLSLQVTDAITRKKKEATVEKLETYLKESIVLFGIRHKGVKSKDFTTFRRALPPDAHVVIAKNTLMGKAAERVDGWESIKKAAELDNAWVFAGEEGVADTVKAYLAMEKKLLSYLSPDKRKTAKPTDISGGVLQGQYIELAAVKKLEDMPTRAQLMTTIGRLIRKIPTKVAIGIKLVPTKVAIAVNKLAIADGADDKERKVGDVFPLPEADPEAAAA